jgi:hypothetical protein
MEDILAVYATESVRWSDETSKQLLGDTGSDPDEAGANRSAAITSMNEMARLICS